MPANRRVVVVSNRVPDPETLESESGGLVVAVRDHLMRAGGAWFGWSGRLGQGYGAPTHSRRRHGIDFMTLDLDAADFAGYYTGYANGVLWPVLHQLALLQRFRTAELEAYLRVNQVFAERLAPEVGPDDLIWVHDFQLMAVPGRLRALGVRNPIGFFLHVPFPPPAVITQAPRFAAVLRDLLTADLLGFQTQQDRQHFVATAQQLADALPIGDGLLRWRGHSVRLGVYPAEIDAPAWVATAERAVDAVPAQRLRRSLLDRHLILGVDRLDPTKGLLEKVESVRALFEQDEAWHGRVAALQVAPPSRKDLEVYAALRRDLDLAVGTLNSSFSLPDWTPLRLVARMVPRGDLAGFMRLARVGLVTPLRDGMNLVAKEYVAAQDPADPGVLVLSRFAGAADQLKGALLVNPFNHDEVAAGLRQALTMPLAERQARWQQQWGSIAAASAESWGRRFLADLVRPLSGEESDPPAALVATARRRLSAARREAARPPAARRASQAAE